MPLNHTLHGALGIGVHRNKPSHKESLEEKEPDHGKFSFSRPKSKPAAVNTTPDVPDLGKLNFGRTKDKPSEPEANTSPQKKEKMQQRRGSQDLSGQPVDLGKFAPDPFGGVRRRLDCDPNVR